MACCEHKLPEQIAVIFDATNRLIINILACSVIWIEFTLVAFVSQKKSLQSDQVAGMRLAYVWDSEKRTELLCGWVWICGWGFIYINGFIYIYVYTFIRIYVYTVWKIKTSFRSLRIFIGSSKSSGKMCALSKKPVQFCLFNVKLHDGSVYFPVSILNVKPVYSQSLTVPSHSFHS